MKLYDHMGIISQYRNRDVGLSRVKSTFSTTAYITCLGVPDSHPAAGWRGVHGPFLFELPDLHMQPTEPSKQA